jgi:hypothetical protein
VFHPEKDEFLLVKPEPLGNAIVTPDVSDLPVIEPVPPFALKVRNGFKLVGVVYLTITTPAAPALANPLPEVGCEPPPPLLAIGGLPLLPPPEDAVPVDEFAPAPPLPYISIEPVIFELTPAPPVNPLPAVPAPPPPPDA